MKSLALRQFLQVVAADPALQEQVGAARTLAQMLQRAQAAGFTFTARGAAAVGA
jgi:predicted ribosomally synthesized peptide with nif11-like leader